MKCTEIEICTECEVYGGCAFYGVNYYHKMIAESSILNAKVSKTRYKVVSKYASVVIFTHYKQHYKYTYRVSMETLVFHSAVNSVYLRAG